MEMKNGHTFNVANFKPWYNFMNLYCETTRLAIWDQSATVFLTIAEFEESTEIKLDSEI